MSRSGSSRAAGRSRRRRRSAQQGHSENSERWMASYMDMVTVLMCLFIVLYAMSTVDQDKFAALRNSLATGFGVQETQFADTAEGIVVPADMAGAQGLLSTGTGEELTSEQLEAMASAETRKLLKLKEQIQDALVEQGYPDAAVYRIDQRGLTVRLVSAETFFVPNSAELTRQAGRIIDAIGPVLKQANLNIAVEGFADVRQPVHPYPTNWELSASRATGVLRVLVEDGGIKPGRISSVGYGDARPLKDRGDLSLNRRVDIVVLSNKSEAVREKLPELDG
ncbi:OmpA family protein [Glutamicibacter soli]|uniref:OmpA family protein n=1 Tax=Glutamicibacter soli TaxID=453836 RepID=A0A6L9G8N5_9MICC|nr:flagellar motor protein MotB [Glutamicibacter soli]NAZ16740.1 OmpA family protein [Glutamicibacter soli]